MSLSALFSHLADLRLDRAVVDDRTITFHVVSRRRWASCPLCCRRSRRVHGAYQRTLADLPIAGRVMAVQLRVRRFRCVNERCQRAIFAERFPTLTSVRARRTHAQRDALLQVGLALGGEAGARLASRLGLSGSGATILRLLHTMPSAAVATPRVLGVDDWARARGQTYGSILVDLEQRRVIDLLADRTGDAFAAWLREHVGVTVIARDRGGAYAEGARQEPVSKLRDTDEATTVTILPSGASLSREMGPTYTKWTEMARVQQRHACESPGASFSGCETGSQGAPAAVQVANRFHLLANVGEALERVLARKRGVLREAATAVSQESGAPELSQVVPPVSEVPPASSPQPTRKEQARRTHRATRLERYEAVVALNREGMTQKEIARRVGIGRRTVRRFMRAAMFPERAQPPRRRTILDPYEASLRERWEGGCHNSLQLWREIHDRGFPGAASLVRRFVAAWRAQPGRRGPPPRSVAVTTGGSPPPVTPFRVPSPRQARWLLLHPIDRLHSEERTFRATLLQRDPEISAAQALAETFGQLIRDRDGTALAPWLKRATDSGLPEFQAFVTVLDRDRAAVEAVLTYAWSNGQTEGQINRLKYLKRQMYGRASLALLKTRILWAA